MEGSSGNSNNLISQFERYEIRNIFSFHPQPYLALRAYADCMASLTEEDTMFDNSSETLKADLDTKISRFTDVARQVETFFLQKQFLLYAHKPELHLKDESAEIRQEIARKDELIRKHNERLSTWLKMLQDVQQQQKSAVGPNVPMTSPSAAPGSPKASMPGPRASGAPTGPNFPPNHYRMGMPGSPSGGPPMTSAASGPLAYLEKTTTSIGGSAPR